MITPSKALRIKVLLLAATAVGVVAGVLSYLDGSSVAGALLTGGGAWGGSLALFHSLLGAQDPVGRRSR